MTSGRVTNYSSRGNICDDSFGHFGLDLSYISVEISAISQGILLQYGHLEAVT